MYYLLQSINVPTFFIYCTSIGQKDHKRKRKYEKNKYKDQILKFSYCLLIYAICMHIPPPHKFIFFNSLYSYTSTYATY